MENDEAQKEAEFSFDYDGENFSVILDDCELVGCQWMPKTTPIKYIFIFFHGLGAFLSINRSFFPSIVQDGGVIFGTDHMGHGRSPGDRGNNTREMLHEELTLLLNRASLLFPNIPVYVYGHSMGGLAIVSYAMTHPKEAVALEGVILEAPWINTSENLAGSIVHKILGKCGRFLFPSLVIDTGDGMMSTGYSMSFKKKILSTFLSHDFITPKLYASAVEMQEICWKNMDKWPERLPLLFMQGGKDASVGVAANLRWAEKMRDIIGGRLRLVYHEDAEHAMLRKESGPIIIDEVIDFIHGTINRCFEDCHL